MTGAPAQPGPADLPDHDLLVDSRGRRCPLPVVDLARAARDAAPGARVLLLATDPAARSDVPAWCRMRGQHLLSVEERGDVVCFVVEVVRDGG